MMKDVSISTLVAAVGLFAGAGLPPAAVVPQSPAATADSGRQPVAIQIHTYTAGARGYDASAYWLESPEGLVLIDALMLRSDARGLVAAMKATGKPLVGILVTHPHLDHVAGISTIRAAYGPTPVFATQATINGLGPTWKRALAEGWPQAHGTNIDLEPPTFDRVVANGAAVTLAGMTFRIQDYGPMEAENNSVIHQVDLNVLFTGDMTVPHAAFYVGEGRSSASLAALSRLLADHPTVRVAFSGHYGGMPFAPLVARNIEDIRHYRSVVTALLLMPDGIVRPLTTERRTIALLALADHMRQHATYGLGARALADMNLAGLEGEVLRELAQRPPQPETLTAIRGLAPLLGLVGHWRGDLRGQATEFTFAFRDGATTLAGETTARSMRVRLALSYDVYQRRYRMTAIDDITGLIDVFAGQFDDTGALVLSNLESGTHYIAGDARVHTRLTIRLRGAGGWTLTADETTDRGAHWTSGPQFVTTERIVR